MNDGPNTAIASTLAATLPARNVQRLRKKRKWTQDDLAAAAEIEQMAVSLIENRRSNPTIEVLEKVAAALEVPFAELFSAQERR